MGLNAEANKFYIKEIEPQTHLTSKNKFKNSTRELYQTAFRLFLAR